MSTEESKVPSDVPSPQSTPTGEGATGQAGTGPTEPTGESQTPEAKDTVTVTAKEDCTVLVDGKSVTLLAGETAEMTPEEALQYANLGLVEGSAKPGPAGQAGGFASPGGADPSVPRRR